MKVNYYYRNPGPGNFSLEHVFDTVYDVLSKKIEISKYYTRKPLDIGSILKVRKLPADIHHITGAVNYLALGLPKKSTIITVHDIGHLTETLTGWKKTLYQKAFWQIPLHQVSHITAISNFTRDTLSDFFKIDRHHIHVIYNPVSPAFTFSRPLFQNSKPVVMQIGGGKNKNIETLIKAVAGLEIKLLLIRKPNDDLIRELNSHRIPFEFRYNLTEEALRQAYVDCELLYFGSTYEGFGLPVIEAQAVGRPVIISDIKALIEISNGSAVQTELNNPENVRQAIMDLIQKRDEYCNYIELGRINAERFNAKRIAEQYHTLYKKINAAK